MQPAPGDPAALARGALDRYLRALWSPVPALRFDAPGAPFIVGASIHLPLSPRSAPDGAAALLHPPPDPSDLGWAWYRAAAAHAAAHLAHSPPHFDATGLRPITRVLLGLLEDARVEALASRQLPGLRRLWAPWHTATPLDGDGFEALMQRLARRLLGVGYADPHPWVEKGCRLLFGTSAPGSDPVLRVDHLRQVASQLGNDIGQMRLPFNPRLYEPAPGYRDDHRWMWPSAGEAEPARAEPTAHPDAATASGTPEPVEQPTATEHRYPEWDRLIGRFRAEWCSVRERQGGTPAVPVNAATSAAAPSSDALQAATRRALRASWTGADARPQSVPEGDHIDLDALIRASVGRRAHRQIDARVFRRLQRPPPRGRAVLLIDQSRSSTAAWGSTGSTLLGGSCAVAELLAVALQGMGVDSAVCGFNSNGRHDVQVQVVKDFGAAFDADAQARLGALAGSRSTRLGAAIRHAAARLEAVDAAPADIVLITDGEPHDVDVHDPRYLIEDARKAVLQANRRRVRVACIVLDPAHVAIARHIVGAANVAVLGALVQLPYVARRVGAARR